MIERTCQHQFPEGSRDARWKGPVCGRQLSRNTKTPYCKEHSPAHIRRQFR